MSSTIDSATTTAQKGARELPWGLWAQQTFSILSQELRKNFLSRRALLLYLLAALPIFLLFVLAILPPDDDEFQNINGLSIVFSLIYNTLILRAVVFFGCAWVFMNLFRGEVVDRSLHYYFLSPIRREVLVVGKYLSGLVTAVMLFGLTTLASLFMLYFPRFSSESTRYFFEGAGGKQALIYLGITTLACIGYGAIFLIVGLFFRNPIIPALLIYGWEWINFLLPPLLKKASVIHYLHSLMPVPMSEGPFAVMAQPTPAWISVPSLLIFTLIVLALAGYHTRRMEISYVGD
ncbi:MAG: type transport system permease protein [Pyrinomonadaceae bacterium]|nr:type transport system permease protein [Pyrinomonadaceae bacterium]